MIRPECRTVGCDAGGELLEGAGHGLLDRLAHRAGLHLADRLPAPLIQRRLIRGPAEATHSTTTDTERERDRA